MYHVSLVYYAIFALILVLQVSHGVIYSDHWAVHIEGGPDHAKYLASKHGFQYVSQVWVCFTIT